MTLIIPLVENLNDFFIESTLFPLTVSQKNPYRDTLEEPIEAGQQYALSVGIFVIISHLPKGKTYRLEVFGRGVGKYLTKSIYDIEVTGELSSLRDISGKRKVVAGEADPMDFMANWKDAKAVKDPEESENVAEIDKLIKDKLIKTGKEVGASQNPYFNPRLMDLNSL